MQRMLLLITLLLFGGLSAAAVWQHGVLGIFTPILQSFAAAQVFTDLLIALLLTLVWLWHDARANQRNPWPWIAITLAIGAFGPLGYLLTRPAGSATGNASLLASLPGNRRALLAALLLLALVSAPALWYHGIWGITQIHFASLATAQVLADLVIALTLVMFWLWRDAAACGRSAWPWLAGTLLFGSFSPLLYLLTRQAAR